MIQNVLNVTDWRFLYRKSVEPYKLYNIGTLSCHGNLRSIGRVSLLCFYDHS